MDTEDTEAFAWTNFAYEIDGLNGSRDIRFSGELDLAVAPQVRECLARSEVRRAAIVQIDLGAVTFIDSSCIGVLVSACKRIRASEGQFSLRCDVGAVRRTLEIAGLIEFLDVQGSPT
jgi:anti-sigma B factor antagonist